MPDSVQPHRWQPTRLPHPWDSPGKNTGVGCHFLLQCMKVKVKGKWLSRVRLLATPWTAAHQAPPPMGFSRQECWSGVPLPSPIMGVDPPKMVEENTNNNINIASRDVRLEWCPATAHGVCRPGLGSCFTAARAVYSLGEEPASVF